MKLTKEQNKIKISGTFQYGMASINSISNVTFHSSTVISTI